MGLYVGSQGNLGLNTRVSGITIARNTFTNYGDDALGVLETDSGGSADGVVISDNTFNGDEIPIELGDRRQRDQHHRYADHRQHDHQRRRRLADLERGERND